MRYRKLGHSSLEISELCLGTMTWGEQNSQADANDQLAYAVERGINFIDTAEMYPVPPQPDTQGRTEQYLGNWLRQSGQRDKLVLATKVAAPGGPGDYLRPDMALDHRNIQLAVEASLERLQTDYIDLYQIHWPHRQTNFFGRLNYAHAEEESQTPIIETLQALAELVRAGKVRYIGISNETPWGVMSYLRLAEKHGLPRIVSIQNPYNLLNRTFEIALAEVAHREKLPLLAYSPLAFGVLSGKYQNDARPAGARITLYPRFSRYFTDNGVKATEAYLKLAARYGLDPSQLALAFVNSRPFLGSNIIGATTLEQLQSNIDAAELQLPDECLAEIDEIAIRYPNPCP